MTASCERRSNLLVLVGIGFKFVWVAQTPLCTIYFSSALTSAGRTRIDFYSIA